MKTKKIGLEQVLIPTKYWETEFNDGWKNGSCPDAHFFNFFEDYKIEIGPKILDIGSGDGRHLLIMVLMG